MTCHRKYNVLFSKSLRISHSKRSFAGSNQAPWGLPKDEIWIQFHQQKLLVQWGQFQHIAPGSNMLHPLVSCTVPPHIFASHIGASMRRTKHHSKVTSTSQYQMLFITTSRSCPQLKIYITIVHSRVSESWWPGWQVTVQALRSSVQRACTVNIGQFTLDKLYGVHRIS